MFKPRAVHAGRRARAGDVHDGLWRLRACGFKSGLSGWHGRRKPGRFPKDPTGESSLSRANNPVVSRAVAARSSAILQRVPALARGTRTLGFVPNVRNCGSPDRAPAEYFATAVTSIVLFTFSAPSSFAESDRAWMPNPDAPSGTENPTVTLWAALFTVFTFLVILALVLASHSARIARRIHTSRARSRTAAPRALAVVAAHEELHARPHPVRGRGLSAMRARRQRKCHDGVYCAVFLESSVEQRCGSLRGDGHLWHAP